MIARRNLLDRDLNLKLTKNNRLLDVFFLFFFFFFFSFFIFFFFFFFSKKNSNSNSNSSSSFKFDSKSKSSREEFFARLFFFVKERESIVMKTRERFRSFLIISKTSSSMSRSTTRSNKRVYKC